MTACVAAIGCALTMAPAAAALTPPQVVGSVSDPLNLSGATDVAVSGNYAYTTAYYAGELTAVNISNPSHPVIAGHSPQASPTGCPGAASCPQLNASSVTIAGGYAYVTSSNANASASSCTPGPWPTCTNPGANDNGTGNSLTIYDIHTNPAVPAVVGTIQDPNHLFGAYGVAVQGGYAFVAAQGCLTSQPCPDTTVGNQFDVIDLSSLASPTIFGTPLTNPGTGSPFNNALDHADSVALSGGFAYVTASYPTPPPTGNTGCVGIHCGSLTIINITNPSAPAIVGQDTGSRFISANDVVIQGNYAYVADQTDSPNVELTIVNVLNNTVVGTLSNPALNGAYRVAVSGNYAYLAASSSNAISVIDVSNPATPKLVATVTDSAHLYRTLGVDFTVSGRYLVASSPYLSGQSRTLTPPYPTQGGPPNTGTVSVIDLDPSPVSVLLTSPLNHSNYKQGQTITASYSCTPGGVFPLTSCTGTLPNGAPIDTSTLGTHTFTVTGTDVLGQTGSVTVTYTVSTTGGPTPSLSGLHESASVWREHGRKHVRHKPPLGTTLTFKLSQTAKVTLSFNRCTGHGRHVCKRTKLAGTIVLIGKQGKNKYFFLGKIGNKFLKPGTYKLVVVASANGKTSSRETISFTIV